MPYSKKECKEWRKNKNKNPKTNRKIKTNGPTYKKIEKDCDKKKKVKKVKKKSLLYTKEECNQWNNNKNKNPKTNRKIKVNGPTYKKIEKQCVKYHIKEKEDNKDISLEEKELRKKVALIMNKFNNKFKFY